MTPTKIKTSSKKKNEEARIIAFTPPAVYVGKEKKNLLRDTIVKLFVNAIPHTKEQPKSGSRNKLR